MIINGKEITAKPIDFNATIELNDLGGDIYSFGTKPLAALRAYLAYCEGVSAEEAGQEIEAHIIGGGGLSDLSTAFMKACDDSAFFKAMITKAKTAEKKQAKNA
uniref:Tail assembly chaperone protein n=1 Tax=Siphoviridae sp. ct3R43 TaxID=2825321 RepID=A0A8S5VG07_9CAUD|nr:MAG TPA: tail assembly chaperone protein [Siphoviridae sp. ct3R43]